MSTPQTPQDPQQPYIPQQPGPHHGHPSQPYWQPGAPGYGQQQPGGRGDAKAQQRAAKAYAKSLRPWWKRKRVLLPAGLGALVLVGSAAGGGSDPSTSTGTAAGSSAEADTPAFPGAEPGDIVGPPGETLILGDVQVTASPLEDVRQMYGGNQLCSTVTYTNSGDESESFNSWDWSLQDPDGAILSTVIPASDDYLRSGELRPGGTVTGDVCFDRQGPGDYVLLNAPMFGDRGAWINTGL